MALVQKYLDYRNSKANRHVYEDPVYLKWRKKVHAFCLKTYWKIINESTIRVIEDYVDPDAWVDSPPFDVIDLMYVRDLDVCWSIPYCTIQYYKTRNFKYGYIGGGPIYVDKEDGEMYQTGSARIDWLASFKDFKKGTRKKESPKWEPMDKSMFILPSS